ncbi:MAG: trypsin-like peptidase domain-containing protein [Nitrospirae bacterium]|nr:trypsin-like peptidase domain-containing protein [Nitrospirota bacterium]MBF0542228.1 trypsin-like peptidase domain-containing protein [Nitrospirota bacterium]
MFEKGLLPRDFIFPLVLANKTDSGFAYKCFLGTGFLFVNKRYTLTASHVIDINKEKDQSILAIFVNENLSWSFFEINKNEDHPTEDVSILKIEGGIWNSPFRMYSDFVVQSTHYKMFGYPEDTLYDFAVPNTINLPRPDLIYYEGYIRRRISFNLNSVMKGNCFFELSEIAGRGCSGSPLFMDKSFDVIGIYVGEKHNSSEQSISYAVRADSFCNWSPQMLGKSILDESKMVL